jgi:hypothetical protein
MRLVYALQFRVEDSARPGESSLPDLLKGEVTAWIADWYKRRLGLDISFPDATETIAPHPLHTIDVAYSVPHADGAAHYAITWRYPAEPDDRLLWESRCEWATTSGRTEFSFLLRLASREFLIAPPSFAIRRPRILRAVVQNYRCYSGGLELSLRPARVRIATLDALLSALQSKDRRLPIVLLSVDPFTDKPLADPVEVADKLVGLAHVYVLDDKWTAFALTDKIGKPLSCFNGAVRTYWPGFEIDANPFDHPVILPVRISSIQDGRPLSEYLLRRLAAISTLRFAYGVITRDALAAVQSRRQAEIDALRIQAEGTGDYDELLKLADEELAELRSRNKDLSQRAVELEDELATAKANVAALLSVHEPEALTEAVPLTAPEEEVRTVRQAVDVAAARFSDRLVFLKSAYTSADDSPYGQPDKVLQAIEAMDDVTEAWRESIRNKKSMGLLEEAFEARGFAYKAKESMTSAGKWSEEYNAVHEGRRVSIEPHLALGKGGPDTCLRIHFFKDDQTGRFVVAHVGRHKTNTRT